MSNLGVSSLRVRMRACLCKRRRGRERERERAEERYQLLGILTVLDLFLVCRLWVRLGQFISNVMPPTDHGAFVCRVRSEDLVRIVFRPSSSSSVFRWKWFFYPVVDPAGMYRFRGRRKYSDLFSYYWYVLLSKVNPDTPAHACGLSAGDQVISINNRNVTNISHQEAKMEITRSGNELDLTVIKYGYWWWRVAYSTIFHGLPRGVVNQQSIPTAQPISQLRTGPVHQMPTPQAVKPSFATPTQVETRIDRRDLFLITHISSLATHPYW